MPPALLVALWLFARELARRAMLVVAGVVVAGALLYFAAFVGAWDAAYFGGAP